MTLLFYQTSISVLVLTGTKMLLIFWIHYTEKKILFQHFLPNK